MIVMDGWVYRMAFRGIKFALDRVRLGWVFCWRKVDGHSIAWDEMAWDGNDTTVWIGDRTCWRWKMNTISHEMTEMTLVFLFCASCVCLICVMRFDFTLMRNYLMFYFYYVCCCRE